MCGCILGSLLFWNVSESHQVLSEVTLANVEALAGMEEYGNGTVACLMSGDSKCPNEGERVKYIIEGFSLGEDEETY